jgi:D-3-phosphoglycerate dehydrogenase
VTKKKVVLFNTEGFGKEVEESYLQRLGYLDQLELIRIDSEDNKELIRQASDAEGVVVMYTPLTSEVLSELKACKIVAIHAIGVSSIDLEAATEHGICVGNVPDYCYGEVAMHTLALFLNSVRKVSALDQSVRSGTWDVYAAGQLHRVAGKTFGLVSFGNIARKVARVLEHFGMELIAYDPYVPRETFDVFGVRKIESLAELFAASDYISVHSPLSDETRHMIDRAVLAHTKPGAFFFNTGRGGLIDEIALKEALDDGRIASAGLDVIENEVEIKSVLFGMDHVTITPHTGFYSEESVIEEREKAILQVAEVLIEGKLPRYLVNKDVDGVARFQQ